MRLMVEKLLLLCYCRVKHRDQVRSQSSVTDASPSAWGFCELTFQLQDGVMRSAVPSSDGVSSAVVPQTLQNPGGCDDRGCATGHPPFIGHRGTDSGTQTSQAANKSQDLEAWHLDIPNVLKISFKWKKWKLLQVVKLRRGHMFHCDDLQTGHQSSWWGWDWQPMSTGSGSWLVVKFHPGASSWWSTPSFGIQVRVSIALTLKNNINVISNPEEKKKTTQKTTPHSKVHSQLLL